MAMTILIFNQQKQTITEFELKTQKANERQLF